MTSFLLIFDPCNNAGLTTVSSLFIKVFSGCRGQAHYCTNV
ncbi:hypothetical protein [Rickettsia endosymbiont of Aspidapion aeneum]